MEGERRFTKLLRPELVQQNGVSLNPDCFSGFKSLRPEEQAQYEEDCANVHAFFCFVSFLMDVSLLRFVQHKHVC